MRYYISAAVHTPELDMRDLQDKRVLAKKRPRRAPLLYLLAARLYLDRELACLKIGHLHLMVQWRARSSYGAGQSHARGRPGASELVQASRPQRRPAPVACVRRSGLAGAEGRGRPQGAALSQLRAVAAHRPAASPLQTR